MNKNTYKLIDIKNRLKVARRKGGCGIVELGEKNEWINKYKLVAAK